MKKIIIHPLRLGHQFLCNEYVSEVKLKIYIYFFCMNRMIFESAVMRGDNEDVSHGFDQIVTLQ